MNDIQQTFTEFGIPNFAEEDLLFFQKDFPNALWRRNNHKKPNILVNEFSQNITLYDDTYNVEDNLFFDKSNHQKLNQLIASVVRDIESHRHLKLDVIESLLDERMNRLGQIRFANGVSIGDEVKNIVTQIRYLETYKIAIQYKIVNLETKLKDLEYISTELLAMEMGTIL